jgi:uncharacterized membrane protein YphA (DoxX/SURF4 family)
VSDTLLVIMPSKYGTLAIWVMTVLLFFAFLWSLNLTAFNYWASGGPPTPHPEIYRMRGNIFFGIACVFFVAFGVCIWSLVQRKKRRTPRPPVGSQ